MNAPRHDEEAPHAEPGPAWLRVAPPAPAPAYHVPLDPLAGGIAAGGLILGRRSDAGLRLADAGLSRDHARLIAEPAGWSLTDLKSRNGTAVNGRVLEPGVAHRLGAGDVIAVGPFTLTFQRGPTPPPPPPPRPPAARAADPPAVPPADGLSRLTDLDPPRVDTALLRAIQQLGGTLQKLKTRRPNATRVCAPS